MIEPITYLYYRCYKLYSRSGKGSPALEHAVLFGIMIYIIIIAIAALINGTFPSDAVLGISLFFSMILVVVVPFFKHRIVKKYDVMGKQKKTIGNIVFTVEILLVISSIIILIMYR
jgi:heme/copper-type cytochrome/quinol oxidase subunit 4